MIQRLRLCISNAGGAGLILTQGTKIPQAEWCSQKKSKQATENKQVDIQRYQKKEI